MRSDSESYIYFQSCSCGSVQYVADKFPSDAVQAALGASLATGSFVDTAYHVFSCRLSDGKVAVPRTVYANSAVLKVSSDHFVARKAAFSVG